MEPEKCLIVDKVYLIMHVNAKGYVPDRRYNLGDSFAFFEGATNNHKAVAYLGKHSSKNITVAVPNARIEAVCSQSEDHRVAGFTPPSRPGFGWRAEVLSDDSQWWFMDIPVRATNSGILSVKGIPEHKGHLVKWLYRPILIRHYPSWKLGVMIAAVHDSGWTAFVLDRDKFASPDDIKEQTVHV